ncbi:hypothetical protein HD806DRAFT_536916 [Xylariaceae sp. AK1471]|nr:hypothetical protein HD806DRAFT_536916 [Xylariaceae sp. AK1471]
MGSASRRERVVQAEIQFNEYQKVSSTAVGVMQLLGIISGEAPDVENTNDSPSKFELVAVADGKRSVDGIAPRAYTVFEYPSHSYHATGMLLSQG